MSAQFWVVCWEFVGRGFNSYATSPISFSVSLGIGSMKVEVTLPHRPVLPAGRGQEKARGRMSAGGWRQVWRAWPKWVQSLKLASSFSWTE